jgi:type I restriction enzyme S subunit
MSGGHPQGWAVAPLSDVVLARKGKKPTVLHETNGPGRQPYLLIEQMEGKPARFFTDDSKMVVANKNDVLVVWDGSIGKCTSGMEGAVGSTIVALTPIEVEARFIEAFIKYSRRTLLDTSRGTGLQHINQDVFWNLSVPVAPLAEQKRIVAKLESVLEKVEVCQQRLARIPKLIDRFRQSVLATACWGKLTADWREDNPEVELFSEGAEVRKSGELNEGFPPSWRYLKLGSITKLVTSGSRGWAKYYSDAGSIFIRAQNINTDVLNLDDVAFVRLPGRVEGARTKVKQHDILLTITGANVTKAALVDRALKDAYVSQHVALVRLADVRLSKFLFLSIVSLAHGRGQLLKAAYGQGKPGLNLRNIRDVVVGVPPVAEQAEIERRVETLFKLADRIEARYVEAQSQVDKIASSILNTAFHGKLVVSEFELAALEGRDFEHASVLLERISSVTSKSRPAYRKRRKRKKTSVSG